MKCSYRSPTEDPAVGLDTADPVELLLLDPNIPLALDGSPDVFKVLEPGPLEVDDEIVLLLDPAPVWL
jgi:hypothetical protein